MASSRLNAFTLSAATIALLAGSAFADTHSWIDPGGGDAHIGSNWDLGTAPAAFDTIEFDIFATYIVDFDPFFLPSVSIHNYRHGAVTIRTSGIHGATSEFNVGRDNGDNADVTLDQGEFFSTLTAYIGRNSGSTGEFTVTGGFSDYGEFRTVGTGADIRVGNSGSGTLNVYNGGDVEAADDVVIADGANSDGVVNVSGFNFQLLRNSQLRTTSSTTGDIFVGDDGDGELNISSGGFVSAADDVLVGYRAGSTGELNVDTAFGISSTLSVNDNLSIGHIGSGEASGDGVVTLDTGGVINVGDDTFVGDDFGGSGTLNVQGGVLRTRSLFADKAGSTINHTGGTIEIQGGQYVQNSTTLSLDGADAGNVPTLRLEDGGIAEIDFSIRIGDSAGMHGAIEVDGVRSGVSTTLRNTGGGAGADLYIGDGGSGTLDVTNGGLAESNDDIIIAAGSTATGDVVVSGVNSGIRSTMRTNGNTANSDIQVGGSGDGTLDITNGGLVSTPHDMIIASGASSTGDVDIFGQSGGFFSDLQVGDDLFIGVGGTGSERGVANMRLGVSGQAHVNDHTHVGTDDRLHIDGGDFVTGSLTLYANNSLDIDEGVVTIDGGTMNTANSSTFNIDGDNAKATPTLRLDNGASWTNTTHGINMGGIHDGYMEILNGSSVRLQDIEVGGTTNNAVGQLTIDGSSSLTLDSFLRVQGNTNSSVEFTDGAQGDLGSLTVRDHADVLIAGAGTHVDAGSIQVGSSTPGDMVINDGASVEVPGTISVGSGTGTSGSTLFIQDPGTTVDAFNVNVGSSNSTGSLWVQNGAELNTFDSPIDLIMDVRVWPNSEIEINDGTLRLVDLKLEDEALLHGSGTVSGIIRSDAGDTMARIAPDGPMTLGSSIFADAFEFSGILDVDAQSVTINDANLANLGDQTIFDGGTLTVPNGAYLELGETISGEGTYVGHLDVGAGTISATGLTGMKLDGYIQTILASNISGTRIELKEGGILEGGGVIDADYRAKAGSQTIATNDWIIGNASSSGGFTNDGVLDVGAHHVTLLDSGTVTLGDALMSGGTLSVPNGIHFNGGDSFTGSGVIDSRINSSELIGGGAPPPYIMLTGDLEMGDATTTNGFKWNWGLSVGPNTLTLHDLDEAEFLGGTNLSGGTIIAANGIDALRSSAISGFGDVEGDVHVGAANALSPSGSGLRIEGLLNNPSGWDLAGSHLIIGDGVSGSYNGGGTLDMRVTGDDGSVIANANSGVPLVMGDATVANGFLTRGHLQVINSSITLHDADYAELGSFTKVGPDIVGGGDTAPRTLIAPNGVEVGAGEVLHGGFGTLDIALDGKVRTLAGSTTLATGTFSMGDAADVDGVDLGGELDVNTRTVTLLDANEAQLGNLTTIDGGTLNAANGVRLESGDALTGNGVINGAIIADPGSTIGFEDIGGAPDRGSASLTLGDASSSSGVSIGGTLQVATGEVHLLDTDAAELGPETFIGGGTLHAPNGIQLSASDAIYGGGTINGSVSGGTIAPGGTLNVTGDVTLDAAGSLDIDLSGTIPGSDYDQLALTGMIELDGDLAVGLSGGYQPQWGDTFEILSAGAITGSFNAELFDALADPNLRWFSDLSATALTIGVRYFTDLDRDGVVGAADLASLVGVWGPVSSGLGFDADFDGDGSVGSSDLATLIGTWGFSAPPSALVPAPGTAVLLVMGLGLTARRPRRTL